MYMQNICTWFKENQTTVLSVGGVVLVIAIIVTAAILRSPKTDSTVSINEPNSQTAPEAQVQGPAYQASVETPAAPKMSYGDAVFKYGDRRIQFGENCAATPANSVWKTGTEVMLDNRSDATKVFRVNGTSYTVLARDYVVAPLNGAKFPQEVLIDCGAMQNVATITIQK